MALPDELKKPAKLDIAGSIFLPLDSGHDPNEAVTWEDLSPFPQGYVEALIQCADAERRAARPFGQYLRLGFSDLSPEALAMILRDCEAYRGGAFAHNGATFWGQRQEGQFPAFPPLRVYLDDAGKVCLANAG